MKLRNIITGAALLGIGSCYGKQAYSAARTWYEGKAMRADSVAIEQALTTIQRHPAVVDSYLRALTPAERQDIIVKSSQMQVEYLLKKKP